MTFDREEMRELAFKARKRVQASGVGSMHSMWDVIFDAEALLAGAKPLVDDPEYIIKELKGYLDDH